MTTPVAPKPTGGHVGGPLGNEVAASEGLGMDPARAVSLLRTMWRIRVLEEQIGQLKRADEVHGLIHLSVGQEGVAAATCGQLDKDDVVYSNHRAHGHAVAKGVELGPLMAELMGRVDGVCGGLGGSMHIVDVSHGFLGATGVVCGNLPMAVGSALASRLRGGNRVAVVFFGDGAVQAGLFNESINLATLWNLPVIFVCENNGFAEFTPRSSHTKVERVSDLVAPYDIRRDTVDGNDVVAVWDAFARTLRSARMGEGPALLECLTHRLRGHYVGDADRYREALAKEEWQEKDPIMRFQREALSHGWFGEEEIISAEESAETAVAEAVSVARGCEFPSPETLQDLVYAK